VVVERKCQKGSALAEPLLFLSFFFPEGKKDYTKNQASWTLLYKKETKLFSGEEKILYNGLNKN